MVNIVRNLLIMLNNVLKTTSKKIIQKTADATGGLIDKKIANRIKKVCRGWPQNNSETTTNEHDKEIHKERYIYLLKKDRKLLMIWD